MNRREVCLALAATGCAPLSVLAAERRAPAYIGMRREKDGSYSAAIVDGDGALLFTEVLQGRGHGAAIAPDRRTAVAFARRPGRFALAIDLERRRRPLSFAPPEGRLFYGHGFFAADGKLLLATENDFENERGVIGLYDSTDGFRRVGEMDTGGIGPHEAILMNDGQTIAVANGGIATHPDYPRQKLNLATMEPRLTYLDVRTGDIIDTATLPVPQHQLSIRHLCDVRGTIWFGGQYEGPATDTIALVGSHAPGRDIRLAEAPDNVWTDMNQYVGSVAANRDGSRVATTSPRGGSLLIWNTNSRTLIERRAIEDVCGAAASGDGFMVSDGGGSLRTDGTSVRSGAGISWDNHLSAI